MKGVFRFGILLFTWILSAVFANDCAAQKAEKDTIISEYSTVDTTGLPYGKFRKTVMYKWNMQPHSPMKATIFSAVLPGTGQIYNGNKKQGSVIRKYWKVPIVYAGMGTCVGFIVFNDKQYHKYKNEYIATMTGGERTMDISPIQLEKIQEQYHQWRDLSYLALAGVYLLQIIDANVDAHLFYFDISRNLGISFHPSVVNTGQLNPAVGMTINF